MSRAFDLGVISKSPCSRRRRFNKPQAASGSRNSGQPKWSKRLRKPRMVLRTTSNTRPGIRGVPLAQSDLSLLPVAGPRNPV